eukprot:TRINITY_DN11578_c3_g1_i3.p1 TRINITY_DN11578_c3_g1~~TRINITY_DN11578_c3_g1_i3.p1  ORF type:complete len:727 (+),score=364.13 TRINITY_DN11578_c3_g1_i3:120-2300(+)
MSVKMVSNDIQDEVERRLRVTQTTVLNKGSVEEKRAELKDYFNRTYDVFEKLYEMLACEEAFQMQPLHKLRHPHIFYYGHTASFFINKLVAAGHTTRINPLFEEMFAIGVDEMQWDDLNSAHYNFPPSAEVKQYRDDVRERINDFIDTSQFSMPITWESRMWPIIMGIEHERIHLETSAVLIRELPLAMVKPHPFWRHCPVTGVAPTNELVEVAAGHVRVGRRENTGDDDAVFGWDVDYGVDEKEIAGFSASKYLVSNQEFQEFMADGGYERDDVWTEEGLGWRNFRKATHPHFWVQKEGGFRYRMWAEEIELPLSWPCEVNNHEAKAFCNWKGAREGKKLRLPTEAEWQLMYDRSLPQDQWQWGTAPGNINLESYTSPCPVDMHKQGDLYDVAGNLWHHTETPIGPLEGFKVHPLYDDFSMPTFDGDHAMQKGGCFISTGNEATRDARFGFRRHFYQFIGIRYVEGEEVDEYAGFYRADPVVDQYTEFHWGERSKALGDALFPVALGKHALQKCQDLGIDTTLAADIGCRSGRTSFELATVFDHVQGIDFSARYIMPGCQLRECQQTKWEVPTEGDLLEPKQITAAQYELEDLIHKTTFWQSDPCNLHAHLRGYTLVVVNLNLVERLMNPRVFLETIHERMEAKSLLVIGTTYDWKAFDLANAKNMWLSGYEDEQGNAVKGAQGLAKCLSPNFTLEHTTTLPYSLPTNLTTSLCGTAEVTTWVRN